MAGRNNEHCIDLLGPCHSGYAQTRTLCHAGCGYECAVAEPGSLCNLKCSPPHLYMKGTTHPPLSSMWQPQVESCVVLPNCPICPVNFPPWRPGIQASTSYFLRRPSLVSIRGADDTMCSKLTPVSRIAKLPTRHLNHSIVQPKHLQDIFCGFSELLRRSLQWLAPHIDTSARCESTREDI